MRAKVLAECAQQGSAHAFMEADKEFHLSLVRRAGNQMLVSIMETDPQFCIACSA